MSDGSDPYTPRRGEGLLESIFGKGGRAQYDDQVDIDTELTNKETFFLVGRAVGLLKPVKELFFAKFLLSTGMWVPGLLLPWIAKIIVDHVVGGKALDDVELRYPPFMDPILLSLQGLSPMQIMMVLSILYVGLLFFIGTRAGGTGAYLYEGSDAATQAENQISGGGSEAGGLWGLLEYWVNVRLTQRMVNFLRTDLFEGLTRLSLTTLQDQRIGDSMYRVLYDAPMVPEVVYQLTLRPLAILIAALIQIYLIEYTYGDISPELVWLAWSIFPIAIAITFPFSGLVRRTNQTKRAAGSSTTSSMEESMDSITAVQSLGGMEREKERFAERSEESFLRERYAIVVWAIVIALGGITLTSMLIFWGRGIAHDVIGGLLTPGDFFALIGILVAIFYAAGELGDTWIFVQEPAAALRRVFFFIDQERDEDAHGEEELGTLSEGVTFENLSYEYPDGSVALKEIDLELPTNSFVAIVGPTGAGKTSLAYMIPALLRPTSGRVLIDSLDVTRVDLDSLRRQVTYVFQEHLLLSESIRDNLGIANPDATESELLEALRTAGCMDFIASMPDGIDTVLGRSGETLSVGQQQRLSIARGLIRNSQILILDEPTAALDPVAENRLVEALTEISKDRLVIVIAHRLSTIRRANRIVFMDQGRVLEVGSHDALMRDNESQYRRYAMLQGVDSPAGR